MTNEEAIEKFEWVLESPSARCMSDKAQLESFPLALSALREQAERDKGCEYCGLETHQVFDCNSCHLVKDRCDNQEDSCYGQMYIEIEPNFCPMCGKRLGKRRESEVSE